MDPLNEKRKHRAAGNRKPSCLLLALLFGLLAACASPQSEPVPSASPLPADSAAQTGSGSDSREAGEELSFLTEQQGFSASLGGETAAGCYSLDLYTDGTADIIYYDYSSETCIRLSADANLEHDPASTAYLPAVQGGVRCLVSGDDLYVIKNGQPYTDPDAEGNDPAARLYCMNLDGTDRKVIEYGANMVFQWDSGAAGDSAGNLYTVIVLVDPETAASESLLVKLGREIPRYEELYSWDSASSARLAGVCGGGFIVQVQEARAGDGTVKLVLIGKDGAEKGTLLEWAGMDITSYTVHDDVLYYTKNGDANIYAKSALDGADLPGYAASDGLGFTPGLASIRGRVRDGRLIVQFWNAETENAVEAALDLTAGQFTPLTLYYGEGEDKTFVGICAEGEKDFLVRVGKATKTRTAYGTDGMPYQFEQGFTEYALIAKTDYWNSVPNYRSFQYYDV